MTEDDPQTALIEWATSYLDSCERRGIDTGLSAICRLDSAHAGPGRERLRLARGDGAQLRNRSRLAAKVAWVSLATTEYKLMSARVADEQTDVVVLTWVRGSDFCDEGGIRDRYFGVSSRDRPNTIWICLSLDGVIPPVVSPEIRLLVPVGSGPSGASRRAIRAAGSLLSRVPGDPLRSVHEITAPGSLARIICSQIEDIAIGGNPLTVVLPYEGQPFQNGICAILRRHPRTRTVGYVHSMLTALPTDFILRNGSPDELVVHGAAQADLAVNFLRWPSARVRVCPSLRYRDPLAGLRYAGQIVLPYALGEGESLLTNFLQFLRAVPSGALSGFTVREHPLAEGAPASRALRAGIESALGAHGGDVGRSLSETSVFLGVTAAMFEALEAGLRVANVVADPVLDGRGPVLWSELKRDDVTPVASWFELQRLGRYIHFGSNTSNLGTLVAMP